MIHYTCDHCKQPINSENDLRYVLKMELYASFDSNQDEADDDRDHLLEIHEILERLDDAEDQQIGEEVYQQLRFDLCSECRKKFVRNPLGATTTKQFDFSEN